MADTGRVVLDSTGHNKAMGTTGTDSADSTCLSLPASGQNNRNIKQKSKIKTADGKEVKIKTKDGQTKVKD